MTPGEFEFGAFALVCRLGFMCLWLVVGIVEVLVDWLRSGGPRWGAGSRDVLPLVLLTGTIVLTVATRHYHECDKGRFTRIDAHLSDSAIRQGWLLERGSGSTR